MRRQIVAQTERLARHVEDGCDDQRNRCRIDDDYTQFCRERQIADPAHHGFTLSRTSATRVARCRSCEPISSPARLLAPLLISMLTLPSVVEKPTIPPCAANDASGQRTNLPIL